LQVTTTNQALWPANTSLLFTAQPSAAAVMPITVGQMGTVIAAADTDFGGASITSTSTRVETNPSGGAGTFDPTTDGLYWTTANHTAVAAGDIRLWIGDVAARGAGNTVGSIVKDTDADFGQNIATSASVRVEGTVADFVYGTHALYYTTDNHANTIAGDMRLAAGATVPTGLNWQGGVGFGGSVYSIPSSANTVTIGQ